MNRGESTASPRPLPRLLAWWWPGGVRTWHFVVFPALGMAALLAVSRLLDRVVAPGLSPDGKEFYELGRAVVISASMAGIIGVLAVGYRSRYEASLQARNVELEATQDFLWRIIEGSADAIITRDGAGKVSSWNRAAEAIFGWKGPERIGRGTDELLPDDDDVRDDARRLDARLRAGETVRDHETSRVAKDGTPVTVSLTAAPQYDAGGAFAGSIEIVRDVTALKELERQLLERERLAAVGELAAVVAHEVRNPLAGIRGGCEILLEGYGQGDKRNEIGQEVIHQVDRLNRTVQDLLLFARPKATDPVPADVAPLIDRVLRMVADDFRGAHVQVERRHEGPPPVALVDARQMEQVLLNLLLNARQAVGDDGGTVTVETRSAPGEVVVSVVDSGSGIPPERLAQIFKPFYTTRSHGTGLGLAIVKKIVEAHGGRIEVTSPPGGGARFTVHLREGG